MPVWKYERMSSPFLLAAFSMILLDSQIAWNPNSIGLFEKIGMSLEADILPAMLQAEVVP